MWESVFSIQWLRVFRLENNKQLIPFLFTDIDFHMNSPLCEYHRVARLYPRAKWQLLIDAFSYPRYLRAVYNILFHPDSLMARCMSPVREYSGVSVLDQDHCEHPSIHHPQPQWLEHRWDHGNLFETWVVRATEG